VEPILTTVIKLGPLYIVQSSLSVDSCLSLILHFLLLVYYMFLIIHSPYFIFLIRLYSILSMHDLLSRISYILYTKTKGKHHKKSPNYRYKSLCE
jgi:hypothetical protein